MSNQSITGCGLSPITASMQLSNCVKQKIIPAEKKGLRREERLRTHLCLCIKSVVAMDDIRALIGIQHETYDLPTAYHHYFCEEFENLIRYVLRRERPSCKRVGQDESDEKELLRSALLSVTHKLLSRRLSAAAEARRGRRTKRKQSSATLVEQFAGLTAE